MQDADAKKKQVLNIFTFSLTFISSKIPSFHKNFLISPIFMMTELAWNSFQVLICSGQTSTIIRQFYGTLHGSTDRSTTDWRPHSIIKHFLEFLPRNMSLSLSSLLYLYLEIFSPLSLSLSFLVMPCGLGLGLGTSDITARPILSNKVAPPLNCDFLIPLS